MKSIIIKILMQQYRVYFLNSVKKQLFLCEHFIPCVIFEWDFLLWVFSVGKIRVGFYMWALLTEAVIEVWKFYFL